MEVEVSEKEALRSRRSSLSKAPVTFDDVLTVLGEFGRYQKFIYFLCSLPYVFTSIQIMGWVFIGASVPFKCKNSEDFDVARNSSEVNGCYYIQSNGTESVCTDGFIYDTSQIQDSVTMEFELVCEREKMHATIGAAPMVGYILGGLIFGYLSDKIGRKPTLLIANFFVLLAGLGGAASPEYFTFVVSRVLAGASTAGVEVACFVMGMELVGKSKRTFAGILCWFFETSGYFLALLLAYLVSDNWRLLQTIYSAPCVFFFSYIWLAPESVRWLISRGRTVEALAIIKKTAKVNKVTLTKEILAGVLEEEEESVDENKYTVLDLFRYKNLRAKTCILLWAWIICSALYYVLLLDQTELSDNRYFGFLITTGLQIPGYFYVLLTLERPAFGRKRSMCAFLIISGFCLFLHPLAQHAPLHPTTRSWLRLGLSLVGRFCANCSYTILYLYSAEQFPTVVRSIGVGFTLVISRFGTIIGPYLLLMGHYSPMVLGLGALTAGLLSLMLPETLGHNLPETLEDGEKFGLVLPSCLKSVKTQRKEDHSLEKC